MAIEQLRKKVDLVDEKILSALNERSKIIKEIGLEKSKGGKAVYDPAREIQVIESVTAKNRGGFPNGSLKAIYSEIMSACRGLEQPLKVAFFGPETTFTHMAALKKFGSTTQLIAKDSIEEVFRAVESGNADYGVVPIENSTEGTVNHTLDRFLVSNLNIIAEVSLDVNHNLLSRYSLKEVKKVYSHPQALAQCRKWLSDNLPKAELIAVSSTAKAAEDATLYLESAAIASNLAAQKHGLKILAENIEDNSHNMTRFLVIGKIQPKKSAKNKTSVVFSTPHKAGALYNVLGVFNKFKLNLTKIESRPSRLKQWEYVFFIDFEGYVGDSNVKKAIGELKKKTSFLKILGSYPLEAEKE